MYLLGCSMSRVMSFFFSTSCLRRVNLSSSLSSGLAGPADCGERPSPDLGPDSPPSPPPPPPSPPDSTPSAAAAAAACCWWCWWRMSRLRARRGRGCRLHSPHSTWSESWPESRNEREI